VPSGYLTTSVLYLQHTGVFLCVNDERQWSKGAQWISDYHGAVFAAHWCIFMC
jgi:hypothetical protein